MAVQDVRAMVPRVRRAIEGPVPPSTGALTDVQVEALAADSIADIILLTGGDWGHALNATEFDDPGGFPIHWEVDPGLSLQEESLVSAQAALQQVFYTLKDAKVSERIKNEGVEWEWSKSASLLRDYLKMLMDMRNEALTALQAGNPVMVRYASILQVRDPVMSAVMEPWVPGGLGGGLLLTP